ncbi:sugar transferase [Candidatus Poribacteria bacterium]|nr:sugar transferase [Candidatus Poribacteria bacterium]
MHYKEYCKARYVHQSSPLVDRDFYQDLNKIAMRRHTVLTDLECLPFKESSGFGAAAERCLDILLSLSGLLVCIIPFLVIAIAIKIDSPGPVFYRQARVGKQGKIFYIIKFRTMNVNAERRTGPVWAAVGDPRLTRVGAFLRKMRLDELPNFFNILKGDMRLIGPRPERPEFVYWFVRYMRAFDRRHDVKPGIAGLAQLKNGYDTSAMSVYRKVRWDIEYIKRKNLRMDVWIIFHTLVAVLRGRI